MVVALLGHPGCQHRTYTLYVLFPLANGTTPASDDQIQRHSKKQCYNKHHEELGELRHGRILDISI
jgi:hypothetical protein